MSSVNRKGLFGPQSSDKNSFVLSRPVWKPRKCHAKDLF